MDYSILKKYAFDLHLTMKEVAARLKCDATYVSMIVNAKKHPGPGLRRKIHHLLINYKPYQDQQKETQQTNSKQINSVTEGSVFFKTLD